MVLRGWLDEKPITLSLKPGVLTVALDEETVLVADRAGRLWSLYRQGCHFRRGLNGNILAKWTDGSARQRRRLSASEADLVIHYTAQIFRRLRDGLTLASNGAAGHNSETPGDLTQTLQRAAAFDVPAAHADVEHYHRVYKPIGILPPDQYMALVLQMTEGCSFNTCTFCTFYKNRPFRIKSPEELRTHITAVRDYMGDSILMRQRIFAGDANALVIPQPQLLERLAVVNQELPAQPVIYAFLDGFSGSKKSARDYAALAERGLRRVYIGLESGHDPLLVWIRKPGSAAEAVAAVRQIKAGGVDVGVIVLLGLGGERYNAGHVRDTISVLNQMQLGREDLLYFSEFVPDGTPFDTAEGQEQPAGCQPLTRLQIAVQRAAILSGLEFGAARPQIATYDIREFIY
jgi:hypothetical protein